MTGVQTCALPIYLHRLCKGFTSEESIPHICYVLCVMLSLPEETNEPVRRKLRTIQPIVLIDQTSVILNVVRVVGAKITNAIQG